MMVNIEFQFIFKFSGISPKFNMVDVHIQGNTRLNFKTWCIYSALLLLI